MDSRYTLKFPRSYREATGQDAHFEEKDPDRWVLYACVICASFLIGMMVGWAS